MDIAAMSISMHQSKLIQDASLSVMKMAMDSAKVNAENMAEMLSQTQVLEHAAQPYLGSLIDIKL